MPQQELDAALLCFSRRVAAALVAGMAETGLTFEQMDAALGQKSGYCHRVLNRLLKGTEKSLGSISDIALAMGCEISFSITLCAPKKAEAEGGIEGDA